MFLESKESNDFENLKLSITRAMNHYINIRKIWEFLTSDGYEYSTYDLSSPFALYFLKMYPEANKEMSKGGVITDNRNSIYYGEALHYAFTEASKELANSFGKYSSKPLTGQH
jgi:hypothetical protein